MAGLRAYSSACIEYLIYILSAALFFSNFSSTHTELRLGYGTAFTMTHAVQSVPTEALGALIHAGTPIAGTF